MPGAASKLCWKGRGIVRLRKGLKLQNILEETYTLYTDKTKSIRLGGLLVNQLTESAIVNGQLCEMLTPWHIFTRHAHRR
jgi:hypothetical protein